MKLCGFNLANIKLFQERSFCDNPVSHGSVFLCLFASPSSVHGILLVASEEEGQEETEEESR